ncbi:MAG TPA: DUF4167 domain-containing protein [Xanthobacteraceae bacterium]|nr:DUF4167 domain-containing protein [Xanthobacteraceae bacterium]
MRGRNRNHKGHHGGGGGGHHHNPLTRVYESNGPEVKIRGTAHHIAEKYLQLARDAQSSGDPVTAENHFQHAEHYLRLIAAAQEQLRQQNPYYQPQPAPGEGNRDDMFDGEDEDSVQPNYGGGQNFNNPQSAGAVQNADNQQPPYPAPREQPQPYGGPQPGQGRGQNYQPQSYQQAQPQPQPVSAEVSDGERLPSFITGAQPQPSAQSFAANGGDNGGEERFPRRRRRHRSAGPRPDMAGAAQGFRGEDGGDSAGNS